MTPEIEQQVNNILGNRFGIDSQTSGQDWTSTDSGEGGYFAPQPVFQNSKQQTYNCPNIGGHFGTKNTHLTKMMTKMW